MSPGKEHVFGVTLVRQTTNTPWGLTIVGGADQNTPIIVTRALPGSPAEKHLLRGDVIKKIGDYDARDIRHQDALNLFINAKNSIKLDVQRDPRTYSRTSSSTDLLAPGRPGSRPTSALSNEHSRPGTPGSHRPAPSPRTIVFPPPNPYGEEEEEAAYASSPFRDESADEYINNQPYRTTPLVLPGAKAKHEKESAPTESYLRHHPNPGMRAPPPQQIFIPQDVLMKQKIVHKQFNTPIGLYSNDNIVDTIHHQTGVTPNRGAIRPSGRSIGPKKTIVYDPAKSETFKALQEEQFGDVVQEVVTPAQPRVFTPNAQPPPVVKRTALQPPPTHTYNPLSRSSASPSQHGPYVNSMGHSDDNIAQSGSFKRLMNLVMGESEF